MREDQGDREARYLMSENNVLTITASDPAVAVQALDALARLDADGQVTVHAAAVVRRGDEGEVSIEHKIGDEATPSPPERGRFAEAFQILVGTVDMLMLGNTLVAAAGANPPTDADLVVGHLAATVPTGESAVVADLTETDPAVVNAAVAELGAAVTRRPIAEFEAEQPT